MIFSLPYAVTVIIAGIFCIIVAITLALLVEKVDKKQDQKEGNLFQDPRELREEIYELARFHAKNVPILYGDGEETVEQMISLEELDKILFMIFE
jgi:hypothetical protein